TIDTIVLDINKEKEEISLGMKQTEINPWSLVREKYPPGTIVEGIVRNVTNYGAFVAIEDGIDALLHVSDISWTKKVNHPSEVLKKGGSLKAVVLSVDQDKRRIAIGLKQLEEDPWERKIPEKYVPGGIVKGTVTKITNFGVFVELEAELEGLLHISELADHKIEQPEDIVQLGQEIEVKVLRVDNEDRKIGLSLKRVQWAAEEAEAKGEKKQEPKEDQERLGGIQSDTEAPAEGRNDVLFGTAIPRIARSVVETQPEEDVEETPAEQPTDAAEETEVKPAEQPTDADEETEVKPAEQPTDAGEEAVVTPAEQPLDADNKTELLETAEASEEAEDNAVDEKPEADDNNSSPA
ncbi:MAG: S1 RNA-binding domain-containing protein, partial [Planctomycetia bacterium]|nr:S1 RNA-binding domain-containing protein [Planctomycetia bacterium]